MPTNEYLLALQAAQGVANIGLGIYDRRQGKNILRDLKDPLATIPESATEALMRSKTLASSNRLPGQTETEQRLDAGLAGTTAGITRTGTDSGSMLQALVSAQSKRDLAQLGLAEAGAQNRFRNEQVVLGQLGNMANEEKRLFDINVRQPFERKLANAFSLVNNGNQLISGGSGQITGGVSGYAANKELENYIKSMYSGGGGNVSGTPTTEGFIPPLNGGDIYNTDYTYPTENYG